MDKNRKVALVTGSSRGIGLAILRELIGMGYFGVMTATSLHETARAAVAEFGENAMCLACDISSSEERAALFSKLGRLDILVNNAGVTRRGDLLTMSEQDYDFVLDANLKGTFFMCQSAAKLMLDGISAGYADYSPRIINICSISSYTTSISRGGYCISKAGVSMVTTLFADRLAEFGIPVFSVSPGIIRTDMTSAVNDKYTSLIEQGLTPIKRWGEPQDIANAVSALASGKLDFSTGQTIHSDGGFHIRRL